MKRMTVYHKSGFLKMELPMKQKYTLTLTARELIFIGFGFFWMIAAIWIATRYAELNRCYSRIVDQTAIEFTLPSRPAVAAPTNLNFTKEHEK